jgi:putative acetyltransferase
MTKAQLNVRPREPGDDAEIAALLTAAFGTGAEARLVEKLRRDGDVVCELVVLDGGGLIAGHILFSRLDARAGLRSLKAVALAPLAVRPEVQRQGIGDALTRAGLRLCSVTGEELAVVLGHPGYYARFSFSTLLAKLLRAPYSGASFMALELVPGTLGDTAWNVTYPPAFSAP